MEKKVVSGKTKGKIKGETITTYEHIVSFDIGDESFRLLGDYVFKDGDEIALFASNSGKGYHDVYSFINYTKNITNIQMIKKQEKPTIYETIRILIGSAIISAVVFIISAIILTLIFNDLGSIISVILTIILFILLFFGKRFAIIEENKEHNEQVSFFKETKEKLENKDLN